MTGYMNPDGSELVGGLNPSGQGQALQLDSSGNLKTSTRAMAGAVALSSPPTSTNAGSDTPLAFSQQVNHVFVQNNTAATCYVEFDAAASTASPLLVAGASWEKDIQVSILHLYTVTGQPINAASGIVVRGWL